MDVPFHSLMGFTNCNESELKSKWCGKNCTTYRTKYICMARTMHVYRKRKMVLCSSSTRLLWMLVENLCKQSIKWLTSHYLHQATKPGTIRWCRISLGKCMYLFVHYEQHNHKMWKLNNQSLDANTHKQTERETQLQYIPLTIHFCLLVSILSSLHSAYTIAYDYFYNMFLSMYSILWACNIIFLLYLPLSLSVFLSFLSFSFTHISMHCVQF